MIKLLASSADPTKLSRTLKGLIPLVLILGSVFGLGITDLDVNQVIDGIITIVVALGTISTAIITVSGIVRKIKIRKADQ